MAAPAAAAPRTVSTLAVVLALLTLYLVWGSTYLGIRFALEGGWPPLLGVSGGRMFLAGAVLYGFLRWRGVAAPTRAQRRSVAISGTLMLAIGNGSVVFAEQYVSSGLTAIALASMPLWMGLFGWLMGRRPSRGEWLGIGIGFAGVLWLNAGSSLGASPLGLGLLLLAPMCWAFGSVWSQGRDLPAPFMTAAGQMMVSGVLLTPLGLAMGERLPAAPTLHGTLALIYLAVFGSIIAFSAYLWLLANVRPALASSYAYINPPVAVVLGVWLAGERFSMSDLGAMAVILLGVIAISLSRARAAPAPRSEAGT